MKNEIWKRFEITGSIENYLEYKSYIESEEDIKETLNTDIIERPTIE